MDQVRMITSRTFIRELVEQAALDLILAPASRALILIQTQPNTDDTGKKKPKLRGILSAITEVIKREDFKSLWKGNLLETIKNCIYKASNILFLQLYEFVLISDNPEMSELNTTIREYLLLFAAEFSTLLAYHPFKVVRIKLSGFEESLDLNTPKVSGFKRIRNCVEEIWRTEGISGFYRGYSVAVLQSLNVMALAAAKTPLFNLMFADVQEKKKGHLLKDLLTVGSPAGVAKTYLSQSKTLKNIKNSAWKEVFKIVYQAFSTIWLYPFSLIQARVIVKDYDGPKRLMQRPMEAVKEIWDREGLDGFYRGVFTNLVINLGSYAMQSTAKYFADESIGADPDQDDDAPIVEDEETNFLQMKKRERKNIIAKKFGQKKKPTTKEDTNHVEEKDDFVDIGNLE